MEAEFAVALGSSEGSGDYPKYRVQVWETSLAWLLAGRFFYWLGMQHARLPGHIERYDNFGVTYLITIAIDRLELWADGRRFAFSIPVSEDLVRRHCPELLDVGTQH